MFEALSGIKANAEYNAIKLGALAFMKLQGFSDEELLAAGEIPNLDITRELFWTSLRFQIGVIERLDINGKAFSRIVEEFDSSYARVGDYMQGSGTSDAIVIMTGDLSRTYRELKTTGLK
jgi:hypothetical protein